SLRAAGFLAMSNSFAAALGPPDARSVVLERRGRLVGFRPSLAEQTLTLLVDDEPALGHRHAARVVARAQPVGTHELVGLELAVHGLLDGARQLEFAAHRNRRRADRKTLVLLARRRSSLGRRAAAEQILPERHVALLLLRLP